MNTTRHSEHRDDHPVELGDAWTLRKGGKVARCILVTHPLGWELRLMTTDLLRSQVCRSSDEILNTHAQWKPRCSRRAGHRSLPAAPSATAHCEPLELLQH
jgi:hypothetical protein